MPGEAIALGRAAIENWNSGDLEAVYTTWDPDIVVRPDPDFPEGTCFGVASARRFWESNRESMGPGRLVIAYEHDMGDRALTRMRQEIKSPSGFESVWEWSMIWTVREGKAIFIEFFIDEDRARRAVGLESKADDD